MHVDTLKFYNYKPTPKPEYRGKFCFFPYTYLQVDNDGDVMLCTCQEFMPYVIGNVYQDSLKDIWAGYRASLVRQSVNDGNFTYCSYSCGALHNLADRPDILPVVPDFPPNIKIDLDRSCNLKCPTCRESVIIEKNTEKISKQIQLFNEIKQWALKHPEAVINIQPVGSGEIFASHSGLQFINSLVDYPHSNIKLNFATNGTLIKKNRDTVIKLDKFIDLWMISIDAATPETYAKVRGGNWNDLLEGLDIIKHRNLVFNFCIQQSNYHEIESFAEFANSYNAFLISYQKISNWGHWNEQWWNDNDPFGEDKVTTRQIIESLIEVKEKYKQVGIAGDIYQYLNKYKEHP